MANDPRSVFNKPPAKYLFRSATHHGEMKRVGSSVDLWSASYRPNIRSQEYEPTTVAAPNMPALVNKLQARLGHLRITKVQSPSDLDESVAEMRELVREEKYARAKQPTAPEPPKAETRLFGYALEDPHGHKVAEHEVSVWLAQHQNDPAFHFSTRNQENMRDFLVWAMTSRHIENPDAQAIEQAYRWLLANGYWEPAKYKRGQPIGKKFVPPKVVPPPTPQQRYDEALREVQPYLSTIQDVAAESHRKKLRQLAGDPAALGKYVDYLRECQRLRKMPLDALKKQYESEMAARKLAREQAAQ